MSDQKKQKSRRGGIVLAALAMMAILTAVFVSINGQPSRGQVTGSKALTGGGLVTIQGQLLGGAHFNTAKWKGKVIIVDFWGTWCPWCVKEAPYLTKLYAKYHHHGLEILGVPLNDTTAAVRRYRRANPQEAWPQLQDIHHQNEDIAQRLGIQGLPTELVIDRHGILKHTLVGYSPRQLTADVQKLLAPAKAAH